MPNTRPFRFNFDVVPTQEIDRTDEGVTNVSAIPYTVASAATTKPLISASTCAEVPFVERESVTNNAEVLHINIDESQTFDFMKTNVRNLEHEQHLYDESLREIVDSSDLEANQYEGGFKLWECSIDLVRYLGETSAYSTLHGQRVADIGCGHGLPGIFALSLGASFACFQDYNKDCLMLATMPNVAMNSGEKQIKDCTRFVHGDWRNAALVPTMLGGSENDDTKFDLIMSCDTLYCYESMSSLVSVIANTMKSDGRALVCSKAFYFGVGGSTAAFMMRVRQHRALTAHIVSRLVDGRSNIREIIEIRFAAF